MKKTYDSKFKSRVAWGADRGGAGGEVSDSSESSTAVEKETRGKCHYCFMVKAMWKAEKKPYNDDDPLKKIGQLELENDFYEVCPWHWA